MCIETSATSTDMIDDVLDTAPQSMIDDASIESGLAPRDLFTTPCRVDPRDPLRQDRVSDASTGTARRSASSGTALSLCARIGIDVNDQC
jgi:hypothetical protein